ncbi:MAG: hypothetical protein WC059_00195 [Candidatus Paceibacterota bacterium]
MRNTEKAFLWIINILEKNKINYKISGGFAARIYGVNRELADIDIVVMAKDIPCIAEETREYIIFGPKRYKDENWDLELLTLNYEGQEIDIAEADVKIFNQLTRKWVLCSAQFNNTVQIDVYGKKVVVEDIDSLISYKSKLARQVDLEDVRQLKERG